MNDNTIKFVVPDEADQEMKALLTTVYSALSEKGTIPSIRSSVTCFPKTRPISRTTKAPEASSAR